MNGLLLAARRIYSFADCKPHVEWKVFEIDDVPLEVPHDFEKRAVEAALEDKRLYSEFEELDLKWSYKNDLVDKAEKWCSSNEGLDDVLLFIEELKIAFSLKAFTSIESMFTVESIDNLKKMVA